LVGALLEGKRPRIERQNVSRRHRLHVLLFFVCGLCASSTNPAKGPIQVVDGDPAAVEAHS
jgi:hypothetical protein